MKKKTKEALIGYLNNTGEIYRLYTQDSWSDEDFLTGAVTDWTLEIMEGLITDKDAVPVIKHMKKVVAEGWRVHHLSYTDELESETEAICDGLVEEAEMLMTRIKDIETEDQFKPLGEDKNEKERTNTFEYCD